MKSLLCGSAYMNSKPPASCNLGKLSMTRSRISISVDSSRIEIFVSPRPAISSSLWSSASGVSSWSLSERQTNLRTIVLLFLSLKKPPLPYVFWIAASRRLYFDWCLVENDEGNGWLIHFPPLKTQYSLLLERFVMNQKGFQYL